MPDFIPRSNGDLLNWLANFKAKITTYAATFGYTAPQITAMQNRCDSLTDKINITEQRKADFQSAVEEIFDVQMLSEWRFPEVIGFQNDSISHTFVVPPADA